MWASDVQLVELSGDMDNYDFARSLVANKEFSRKALVVAGRELPVRADDDFPVQLVPNVCYCAVCLFPANALFRFCWSEARVTSSVVSARSPRSERLRRRRMVQRMVQGRREPLTTKTVPWQLLVMKSTPVVR